MAHSKPQGDAPSAGRRSPDHPHPELLPIEPTTGMPLPPKAQPGYYPGFSTVSQRRHWDAATRAVVLHRLHQIPTLQFFSVEEAALLRAIIARMVPQDDRDAAHQIPIVPRIDERLASGRTDGYRYADMPPDQEAYRLGLQAIQVTAHHLHGKSFLELGPREQDEVLKTLHDGDPPAAQDIWQRMPVQRYWTMMLQDAVDIYYAHPYAWDEIGFGGPAYPRGYMRQENGQPEPWEVQEQRYDWAPPPEALSTGYSSLESSSHPGVDMQGGGEGGTH